MRASSVSLAERALAHAVGSQVEQCYARSDVLERRREVMEAWGAFLVESVLAAVAEVGCLVRRVSDSKGTKTPQCYARFARSARGASEGGPAAPLRTPPARSVAASENRRDHARVPQFVPVLVFPPRGLTGSWRSRPWLTRSGARSSSAMPAATC